MKNLCDLLSQQPDVSDAPDAKSIPILRVWTHNRRARAQGKPLLRQRRCGSVGCGEILRPEWRFCAYCGSSGVDVGLMGEPEDEDEEEEDESGGGGSTLSPMQYQPGKRKSNKIQASSGGVSSGGVTGGLFGLRTSTNPSHTHTRLPESSGHGLSGKRLLMDEDSVRMPNSTSSSLNNNRMYSLDGRDVDSETMDTGTSSDHDHLSIPTGGSLSSMDGTEGG